MRRRAFTLTEMLVVIAIIGVLASLLMGAVQYSRERARQASCLNNLRQIGLGLSMHQSSHQRFPNGGGWDDSAPDFTLAKRAILPPPNQTKSATGWGWAYQLLPYIEERAIYNAKRPDANDIDGDGNTTEMIPDDDLIAATPARIYFCPTRRPLTIEPGRGCGLADGNRGGIDYAGNGGHHLNDKWIVLEPPGIFPDESCLATENGAFQPSFHQHPGEPVEFHRGLGVADMPDGASATILVGERRYNRRFEMNGISHQAEDNGYVAGFTWDTIRWGYEPPTRDLRDSAVTGDTAFGSAHAGVAQFVFCDGSTKAISYTVDADVFRALCGRNDKRAPEDYE